jgi:hypothetical protein
MKTTGTRRTILGEALFGAVAPVLLVLGAGTAHAIEDVNQPETFAIVDLATRTCASCVGFDPQPDPPAYPNPRLNPPPGLNPPPDLGVATRP